MFIHPELPGIIASLSELITKDNVGIVRVTTNGTTVPSDEFCREFKKLDNGYVVFSDYGELSAAKDAVYEKLSAHEIPIQSWPFTDGWRSLGDTVYKGYTKEEADRLFRVCHGKIYYQLYNGHLYHCYRSPVINEDLLPETDANEYLDLSSLSSEGIAEKLPDYMNTPDHFRSCEYCEGFHMKSPVIPVAEQLPAKSIG